MRVPYPAGEDVTCKRGSAYQIGMGAIVLWRFCCCVGCCLQARIVTSLVCLGAIRGNKNPCRRSRLRLLLMCGDPTVCSYDWSLAQGGPWNWGAVLIV